MHLLSEALTAIESAVTSLGPSPWLILAVLVLSCIDGFFPPVPSESIVIAAAVLAVAGGVSTEFLVLLVAAAAAGALLGDLIVYSIGSRVPVERLRMLQGPRGRSALERTRRALSERGSTIILTGRFIPVGRVAVNMTAGAVAFPRRRFLPLAAAASALWAVYSAAMGLGAGHILRDSPLLALCAGVLAGALSGLLIDRLVQLISRRHAVHSRTRRPRVPI